MSGSQKFVFIVSIFNIISGIFSLIFGIAVGFLGMAGDATTGVLGFAFGFLIIVGGLLALINGLIGMRAAKDASKAGLLYFISLFSLIVNVLSFIGTLRSNGFQFGSLLALVMPVLMFVAARNIRNEGRYQ